MNKKGFTLIELLAVIVVLGVVLLLAMPSILDSINASRDSSYKILIGIVVHRIFPQRHTIKNVSMVI